RGPGRAVLRDGAPLGRRHRRPGPDTRPAGPGLGRRLPQPAARTALRPLPDGSPMNSLVPEPVASTQRAPASRSAGFDTVLVADRGEVARRVTRTRRERGFRSVAGYSEADTDAPHVRDADAAVRIGAAAASESYLRVEAIIDAARR